MLALLRRKAQSPYIQATVVAIIVVFMFWGVGVNQGPGRNDVATVNGEPITYSLYRQTYDQILDRYRQQFGGSIPEALKEQLDLKKQVLHQLIHKILLQQGGDDMGIHISNLEIQKTIENMAVFQVNGSFDKGRYEKVLKNSGMTPSKFEQSLRSDILADKVDYYIKKFSGISPLEIDSRLNFHLSERQIDYVSLQSDDFTDQVEIQKEKLREYFRDNRENYRTEPRIKLQYLYFSGEKTGESVKITEKMIEDYYNRHQEDFHVKEKRRASHILLKTSAGQSGEDSKNAGEKHRQMKEILDQVKSGKDFSELARRYSEDKATAPQGGDLGYFTRGRMTKPFEEEVFGMKEGEISDIVQTRFGLHLIKLQDIVPARTKPLTEVKEDIEQILRRNESERVAFSRANKTYEKIIKAGSLAAYARKNNITPEETGFFSVDKAPEPLSANPAALKKVFQLNEGELSSIIEGDRGYFIIYLKKRQEPYIPELVKVKDQVRADMKRALGVSLAKKKAEKILETAARQDKDLETAATETIPGIKISSSGLFSRSRRETGLPDRVLSAAFKLTEKEPYPGKVVNAEGSFYVIHLNKVRKPDPEQIKEKKAEFRKKMIREKQAQIINAWLDHQMQKSKISINKKRLDL
ncbi:MAG: SurA N-terminal domain-containing protein [Thermodesulfobacteriota bacterium]